MWYGSGGEKKKNIVASSHPALGHQMIYYRELCCDIVESTIERRIPTSDKAGGLTT